MEVPTIVSYSLLRGILEQNADIPVPPGRGGLGGLQEFGADHDSRGGREGGAVFKVYAQDRIQQRLIKQITLKFQFLRVVAVLEVFPSFSGASSSQSAGASDEAFTVFFALFPKIKKVRRSAGRWVPESPRTPAHPRCP